MADGKTLQPAQALEAAQGAQNCHQKEVPSRNAHATADLGIRYHLEVADQVDIGGSRVALELREEAIPPTSTHARSPGKRPSDRL